MTVVNKTAKSVEILWSHPTNLFNGGISFYVALARKTSSNSETTGEIVAGNITTSTISDLHPCKEYRVSVAAVDGYGMPFKSADALVMTDQGGELCILLLFFKKSKKQANTIIRGTKH